MERKRRSTSEYATYSTAGIFALLETASGGLAESEAMRRLQIFGYNEITEQQESPLRDFLRRFWGPMPWLLELAMVLSLVLKHYPEGCIIFFLLTLNAILGQMHSRSSQETLALLKKKLAVRAKVLRDGTWVRREAGELVPGDVISIGLGDISPADAFIAGGELSVDQSALTGESLAAEVREKDVIYASSVVRRGEARCVVVNTGEDTYFGRTAELVKRAKPKSHQEEVMLSIVRYMMYAGMTALAAVCLYAMATEAGILLVLTFAITFLMGAVPVALPAVLTIVQSVGAKELAGKGALVTRLDSIEDAASIDILCLDKTGTITQNSLAIVECISFAGYAKDDVIALAAVASQEESMDAIDLAVFAYAKQTNLAPHGYRLISFVPFDPSTKRTEAVADAEAGRIRAVKGAVQVVISLCRGIGEEDRTMAERLIRDFSGKGYRTIAVARSRGEDLDNLELAGLLPMADPLRPDSKSMIDRMRKLGIRPLMLTGDNIAIAREVGLLSGIGGNIVRMGDVRAMTEDDQLRIIGESDGFAEIYPEDKYRIVKLLQSRGHAVGMTGDGVNDAPALKQAEMGIAVSNASDVAKASASVVLTETGMGVIVDAVTISRQTYQRMLTWVINKITKVIEFVGLLTLSFFWLHDIVLSLLGMSLLVFANDFVTMSLATDNVVHTPNPNRWNVKDITLASLVPGLLLIAEGLLVIVLARTYFHLDWERLRALVMLNLVFNSQFRVLIVRERRHFWSSLPSGQLIGLSAATIACFALLGVYGILVPSLAWHQVLVVLTFSTFFTLAIDFPKYYAFRRFGL